MNGLCSRLTRLLSQLLDSGERDIALGDIAELRLSDRRAFAGMLGLVMRRQLQPWKQPRAWFVLLALVFPIPVLLAFCSNELSAQLFPKLILWSHYHGAYRTGVTTGAEIFGLFLEVGAIMLGSWSSGFAIGALSHTTRYIDGLLFCVALVVAMSLPITPFSLLSFCCTPWGLLPLMIALLLILAPAFHGLSRSAVGSTIQAYGLIFFAIGTAVIGILTAWVQGWGAAALQNWSQGGSALTLHQLLRSELAWGAVSSYLPAIFLLMSPALYLLADHAFQRMRSPIGKN